MSPVDVATLNAREAQTLLGISRATLNRLMQRGMLEPVEKPTAAKRIVRLKFRKADVERLNRPVTQAS